MFFNSHVPEGLLIDYVSGDIAEADVRSKIAHHLEVCRECLEVAEGWKALMGPTSTIVQDRNDSREEAPSTLLKNRVMKSYVMEAGRNRTRDEMKKRRLTPKLAFSLVSAAAVLLLTIGLFHYPREQQQQSLEVLHNDEIVERTIQFAPETNQLDLIPLSSMPDIQGGLWINPVTNEMLLEVNGLSHLASEDYQLWIIHTNDAVEGELLQIINGSTQVMYRGMDINQLKLIKASVEPLGGSLRPTGPETFIIEVKK